MVDLTGGKSPTFTGTYTGSGTGRVQLASGTFAGSGAVLNFPSGLFVFSGGTLGGSVTNSTAGFITDSGGTLSGTLTNQGTIVQPSGTLTISGTLSNAGNYNIALASTGSVTSGSGTFTNSSAGTLELTTNVTATLASPFANQGGLVETTAAVSAGSLVLGGGGTSTGGTYDATTRGRVNRSRRRQYVGFHRHLYGDGRWDRGANARRSYRARRDRRRRSTSRPSDFLFPMANSMCKVTH